MIWFEVLLAVIAPAIAGGIIYAGQKHLERASGWIATAAMCMSALWILRLSGPVVDMYNSGGNPITIEYSWVARSNIRFGFLIDTLNLPIGLIVIAVTALSCFYSVRYMENEQDQRGYFGSLLLVLTGMIGVLFSIDLVQFYLFWELMLIPSYLLIARQGASKRRLVVAFKYFIFTHIGALLLLLGIVTMFSYTGTFNLAELPQKAQLIPPDASSVIFMLLLLGFLVKMAAFPLHTWLPDTYSEAPIPVAAIFSGAVAPVAAYGMVRVLMTIFFDKMVQASNYLLALAVVTMLYGGLVTFSQTDIRRLLAYSSISQTGYTLFGLATVSSLGVTGTLLHITNHAICKALLFMGTGTIFRQTGKIDIRRTRGLMKKMPITGITCLIGAFSLAGTPPLMGFWGEWMMLAGAVASGKLVFALAGVVGMLVTAGYLILFLWRVFFGPVPKALDTVEESPRSLLAAMVFLAFISVLLGLWPGILLEFFGPAATYLCQL